MSNLAEARKDIELEDVAFRSSISEAVGNKIGASLNFINRRQLDKHNFNLNGPYAMGAGSTGADGIFVFPFDAELVAYALYNETSGISGTTEIDIKELSPGGAVVGSIFSTTPKIATTAASGAFSAYRFVDSTTLAAPTGHTLAVATTTTFTEGSALRLDLVSAMSGARTLDFTIYFRPI